MTNQHVNESDDLNPLQPKVVGSENGNAEVRLRLLLAYDGTSFHGFADQGTDVPTVARSLRFALGRMFSVEPLITCAGRTDTGVHAWGQVVSFDVAGDRWQRIGATRLQQLLNRQLAPSIVVRDVAAVDSSFDARFSAKSRRYRYTVLTSPQPSPFLAATSWWIPDELDVEAMNQACAAIVGERDFSSFCRRPDAVASLTRNVLHARWIRPEVELLRFEIEATAFCHQMVRSLTGMLVAIGLGKRSVAEMAEVLHAKDRQRAAPPAPPAGLVLWEVNYG